MRGLAVIEDAREGSDGKPSCSPAYAAEYAADGPSPAPGNPANLYASFKASADKHPSNPALGWRPNVKGSVQPYAWMTYSEAHTRVSHVGAALKSLKVAQGDTVGIYATNSPEWMLAMKGCDYSGACCVPLYDTFGPDAVKYIIQHSSVKVVFCASDKFETLSEVLPKVSDQLSQVVVWSSGAGPSAEETVNSESAESCGVPCVTWEKMLEFGKSNPADATPGDTDSLCTIMYTSGTTGDPKGVEISHRAVLATVGALARLLDELKLHLGPEDVFLSYLPLAHIFDRVAEELFLAISARVGYWQGSAKTLMDDVGALRPTLFVGVPRIFDRIYSGVTSKVSGAGFLQRAVFSTGCALKHLALNFGMTNLPLVDQLVFDKIKSRLGGRVKCIVSGGAPLAQHVEHFLKLAMCCPVTQGYGLTETCGASMIANPYDIHQQYTIGMPVAGLLMRLESIPDMGYDALAEQPRGELLLKGPGVFSAFHKQPDLTDEVKDADGWFHTGDIGELLPSGAMRIIDRKKNLFKLAHGEYVAVEKLENQFKKANIVDQIWVHGDSDKSSLVGVVVPVKSVLTDWGKENGKSDDFEELCADSGACDFVQQRLEQEGRNAGLKGFEIVKKVHLSAEEFSVDNDLITPSFKLKRPQLKKRYKETIDKMYKDLGQ